MATKRKTATKKTGRTLTTPTGMPELPLPSPEWLAEMAVRVRAAEGQPQGKNYEFPDSPRSHDTIAASRALDYYRAAQYVLSESKYRKSRAKTFEAQMQAVFQQEILPKLTATEKQTGTIPFTKGIRLITGQEDRAGRAEEWFQRFVRVCWPVEDFIDEMPDFWGEGYRFTLEQAAEMRVVFRDLKEEKGLPPTPAEKTFEKVLAARSAKTFRKSAKRPAR